MKAPGILHTERLVLRRASVDDAEAAFRYASDPEVTTYLSFTPSESIEPVVEFLLQAEQAWQAGTAYTLAITTKVNDDIVGMIDFEVTDRGVVLGYALERSAWGLGYMTEAVRAVIDWAFTSDDVYRVWTYVGVANLASQRVLEKVGMIKEGMLHRWLAMPNVEATPQDAYVYAIWL